MSNSVKMLRLKEEKEDLKYAVCILKVGSFYVTYENDSIVMHAVTDYKVVNQISYIKLGFPLSKIEDIKKLLENEEVNYIIIEDLNNIDIKQLKTFNNNRYSILEQKGKDSYEKQQLLENIRNLLEKQINEPYIDVVLKDLNKYIDVKIKEERSKYEKGSK